MVLTLLWFHFAALGPGSLFGLATFSHKVGLYDVQGPIPVVKNVFVPPDSEGSLPVALEDVMPLSSFLAPVCFSKDCSCSFFFKSGIADGDICWTSLLADFEI